jgi:hypothetical protein
MTTITINKNGNKLSRNYSDDILLEDSEELGKILKDMSLVVKEDDTQIFDIKEEVEKQIEADICSSYANEYN